MSKRLSVTVVGDINVEVIHQLGEQTFSDMTSDQLVYGTIETTPGGTAVNFSLEAGEHFAAVHLIGRVGNDPFGSLIIDELIRKGVIVHCGRDSDAPTGLALYLRDARRQHPSGIRLLIVQAPSANEQLDLDDIEQSAPLIESSDLLVVDGYCLRSEPRRTAVKRAMERAHVSGVTVAFDVVPHTLYDRWDLSELAHVLAPVDVVTVEVRTIRRFLGLPAADVVHDHDVARATASVVGVHFKEKVFILRYGLGNIEETLYCWPGRDPMHASTGYVRTGTPRGFGDRLSARELPWVVQRVKQEARRRL